MHLWKECPSDAGIRCDRVRHGVGLLLGLPQAVFSLRAERPWSFEVGEPHSSHLQPVLPSSVHERYSAWVQAQLDRTAPDPLTPAVSQPCPLFFLSFFFFDHSSSLIWGVHVVLSVWQSTGAWSTHKGGSGRRPLGKLPLPPSQPTVHSSSVRSVVRSSSRFETQGCPA